MMAKYDSTQNKPVNKGLNSRLLSDTEGNLNEELYPSLYMGNKHQSFNGFCGTTEFSAFPLRQMFVNRHGRLPFEWDTGYIKNQDVQDYVSKNKKKILVAHYAKNGYDLSKCVMYFGGKECIYVFLHNRGTTDEEVNKYSVVLLFKKKTKVVDSIIESFIKKVIPEEKDSTGFINIIVSYGGTLDLKQIKVTSPEIDFSINYNKDFEPIHELILQKLSIDNSKGLVLLHGKAGTGKTTYIRWLINNLKKRVIYVPPNMTNQISSPEFINFLMENSNSVLVIEDAENVLMKRASNHTQAIANILNLSDGLLSDCANIQIVATFNTDILNIDNALLRKGRLIAKYEFQQLEANRVKKLSKKLGFDINEKQTLAEIYNSTDLAFDNESNKVGFKN